MNARAKPSPCPCHSVSRSVESLYVQFLEADRYAYRIYSGREIHNLVTPHSLALKVSVQRIWQVRIDPDQGSNSRLGAFPTHLSRRWFLSVRIYHRPNHLQTRTKVVNCDSSSEVDHEGHETNLVMLHGAG